MIEKQIQELTSSYQVTIQTERRDERSTFITVSDKDPLVPPIIVHSIDEKIYAIHFLNNEFFEEPEETLWFVFRSLLKGNYLIKQSFFKKQKSIKIAGEGAKQEILPEKVHDSSSFQAIYNGLPKAFSKQ